MLEQYQSAVARMLNAFSLGDVGAFYKSIDDLAGVRDRSQNAELAKLADELQMALRECSSDPALTSLRELEVQDARARLYHVIAMTEEAAHQTLEHVEQCASLAAGIAARARQLCQLAPAAAVADCAVSVQRDAEELGAHLKEVLLAQTYQDLTGQIIKRLIEFVGDVETVLEILRRLGEARSVEDLPTQLLTELRARRRVRDANGFGPRIPGASSQAISGTADNVDQLLSDLGI